LIDIGPWRFTDQDAVRTLEALDEVIAHAAWSRPTGLFDELRSEVEAMPGPETALSQRLETAWRHMQSVRWYLERGGHLPSTLSGSVAGIFLSGGGVPKRPVPSADVTFAGLTGDRQATRRHHGRPWQALCLWSADVVASFASAGHPIYAGAAGENLSLAGIAWALVRPGVRLRIGEVLCEVSTYSIPCRNNAQWFSDRRFDAIHHSQGWVSRVYATVLEPGSIAVGDPATLEPGTAGTLRHTPALS